MRPVLLVLMLLGSYALPAIAAPPVARIEAARNDYCIAPCAVFLDGRKSSDPDLQGEEVVTDLTYHWHFGDSGSGNWDNGVSRGSRNVDVGFIAGHVYETPGTFTATLRVWDGTSHSTATTRIVVSAPADLIPASNTFCFSNDDYFADCPVSSAGQHIVTNDFANALKRCRAGSQPAWCLFHRGDTFNVTLPTAFARDAPRLIEAFGTGSKPRIEAAAGIDVFVMSHHGIPQDVRIVDLAFDASDAEGTTFLSASSANYKKLLLLRVDIENFHNAVNAGAGRKQPGSDPANDDFPDQLAIVDVTTTSRPGRGGTDYYIDATRVMIMGSEIGDADGPHHNIRFRYNDGTLMTHSRFGGGCGPGQHVIKVTNTHHNSGLGCGSRPARHLLLSDSIIEGCQANDIVVQFAPNSSRWFERLTTYVAERNLFRHGPNRKDSVSMLLLQGPRMVARHNIFLHDGENATGGRSIQVGVRDPRPCRSSCGSCPLPNPLSDADKPVDVQIYNNSFYGPNANLGQGRSAIFIELSRFADRAQVSNNLAHTEAKSGKFTMIKNKSQTAVFCNGGKGCNPQTSGKSPYSSPNPNTASGFMLRPDAKVAGVGVPVAADLFDIGLRCRGAKVDPGAWWSNPGDCPMPLGAATSAPPAPHSAAP